MATRRLRPDQVAADIQKQRQYLTGGASGRNFNRKVVGPVMVTGVIMRFATGKGPKGKPWLSGAKTTKLGGKYSSTYNTRPSGRAVSSSSIRNTDTGALANAHTVKKATEKNVVVGPGTRGKGGKAVKIMEREASYGNYAVGWDKPLKRVLDGEIQAFVDEIAMGRKPRYLPKSRIRTRV